MSLRERPRRPTASDRDLANLIERLPLGRYRLDVTSDGRQYAPEGYYFGLVPLKREGSIVLRCQSGNRIEIYPVKDNTP